jgi:hypothetical protein
LTEQAPATGGGIAVTDKELQGLWNNCGRWTTAAQGGQPGPDPTVVTYNIQRTDLLEKSSPRSSRGTRPVGAADRRLPQARGAVQPGDGQERVHA